MGDLKKLYKKAKKYKDDESGLNFDIDLFLDSQNRGSSEKRLGSLHPSQLSKGIECERWWYYYLSGEVGEPSVDAPKSQSIMAMEIGTGIHNVMHRIFYGMGILEGLWECSFCGSKFWGVSPSSCPNCWAKLNVNTVKFKEVPLSDGLLKGHSDGILNRKNNRCFLEMKSIKNVSRDESGKITGMYYGFELLDKPIDEHIIQSNLYMDIWNNMVEESKNFIFIEESDGEALSFSTTPTDPVMKAAKVIGKIPVTLILYVAKNSAERKVFGARYEKDRIKHILSTSKKIRNAFFDQDIDRLMFPCYDMEELGKKKCRYRSLCEEKMTKQLKMINTPQEG